MRSALTVNMLTSYHGQILVRVTGEAVAWIYEYGSGRQFAYRLMNYEHKRSRRFDDLGKMLKEIEREVL